jgi:macrolide-specific efflux system membrane fusion protein
MKSLSKKKIILIAVLAAALAAALLFIRQPESDEQPVTEITPYVGSLRLAVATTGAVAPKNRLEIMPSVAGRVESILVREGDYVRVGQVLVLMSSTERAALIDAARLQGAQALKYWQEAYKPIQIVAPIQGTVIVRNAEPGQTVNTASAIIVISDRLIVKAQVDETDIGRVVTGQSAEMSLDSHPEILVGGRVSHIYYESTTVNNVTIYYVEITPERIPPEFRSGMSATVDIIQSEKKDILIIPLEALIIEGGESYVMVKTGVAPEKRHVTTGISTEENIEITGGITKDTILLVFGTVLSTGQSEAKKNPLMPQIRRR